MADTLVLALFSNIGNVLGKSHILKNSHSPAVLCKEIHTHLGVLITVSVELLIRILRSIEYIPDTQVIGNGVEMYSRTISFLCE